MNITECIGGKSSNLVW